MLRALQEVDAAFAVLGGQYEARRSAAEGQVRTWSYASAPRFDPRPHYFDCHGWAPGRTTRALPNTKNQGSAEGVNAQGQVVVERCYNTVAFYETFLVWSAQLVEVAHFDYWHEKKPIYLLRLEYSNGLAAVGSSAAIHGVSAERFEWAEGKLQRVEVHHSPRSKDGSFEPPMFHHANELFYGSDGRLQRIEVAWPATTQQAASRELVFERRSYGIYRRA